MEILILALFEHRIFGWRFMAYMAKPTESGSLRILGTPGDETVSKGNLTQKEIKLIDLAAGVSDQSLQKAYSKKKSLLEFQKEVTEQMLERYIRPRIEMANKKIVEQARLTGTPVYLRKELRDTIMYDRFHLQIMPSSTHCVFNFHKLEDGLNYYISLTNKGEDISLQTPMHVILSDKPSVVLLGNQIHTIEKIESKKLVPFFTKDYIHVPAASEDMYLRNFALKTMTEYDVRFNGIPAVEIQPRKHACLSLEQNLSLEYVFVLSFSYEEEPISPESKKQKIVRLVKESGRYVILWFRRDGRWERELTEKLRSAGLEPESDNAFSLPHKEKEPNTVLEWLNNTGYDLLQDFTLTMKTDQNYFTGPLSIHTDLEEKIDWFELNIFVLAGVFRIPFSRFRKYILQGKTEYPLPDGSILILPESWFEKYHDLFRYGKDKGKGIQVRKVHAPVLQYILKDDLPEKKQRLLRGIFELPKVKPEVPTQIHAELRPYQKEGFYWLEHLYKHRFGGCLADDMGLGKTLQAITLLQYIYAGMVDKQQEGADGQLSFFESKQSSLPASLVVVPTSLLHNWRNELTRFAPDLNIYMYAGNRRLRTKDIRKIFNHYQVVITSYGVLRNDIEFLQEYNFQLILLDESQYIKNRSSLSYQSVKQLHSEHRFVLTGTPIENSLDELWTQFHFINEGLLSSYNSFRKEFIQPIVKGKSEEKEVKLKRIIAPFMLRRTKEEVAPELPPLIQETVFCNMTEAQQTIYNAEKNKIRNSLLDIKGSITDQKANFIALEGLTRLRQLACHPKLVVDDYSEDSGKFDQIILSYENLMANKHKVLIFSSYVRHLNLLANYFNKKGWKYAMLTGETQKREEEISKFTEHDDIGCFFISLKAGSVGLNLTAADYVFIIDPWWNPAVEMQALSRAHRIGQDKTVIAYRFISSETIEEKILFLQTAKSSLYETFVNIENPLMHIGWDEIEEILS